MELSRAVEAAPRAPLVIAFDTCRWLRGSFGETSRDRGREEPAAQFPVLSQDRTAIDTMDMELDRYGIRKRCS